MREGILRKGLVLGIILLFVGTCVSSTIIGSNPPRNQNPIAEIVSIDPNPANISERVNFVGRGRDPENGTKYFSWDFNGDGTWEILNYPISGLLWRYHYVNYTYTSIGNFTVYLRVYDSEGGYDIDSAVVEVSGLFANFSYAPINPTIEDIIQFTDTSIDYSGGNITLWYWDFGDGNTSTQQNTTHQYPYPGIYPITLIVTNNNNLTNFKTKNIAVLDFTPPEWRNQSQNMLFLKPDENILLSAEGWDSVALDYAWLSSNETGLWDNFTGTLWGWNYRKQIIINHTKIEDNLTDFPILIHYSSLDFTQKAQSDGDDFKFVSSDDNIKYNHEIEYYNHTTGELIAWVDIPFVSSTNDTSFYIYYGNSNCSSQQNPTETWDSNYITVYHLKESSGIIHDSTSKYNGTTYQITYGQPGMVDGSIAFTGSPSYIDYTDNLLENRSVELWANFNSLSHDNIAYLAYDSNLSTYALGVWGGGNVSGKVDFFTSGTELTDYPTSVVQWNFYALTYNFSNGRGTAYVNGSFWDSKVGWVGDKANNLYFGYPNYNAMSGSVDEFRLSKVVRNSSWIKTSYNTMSSPSTFVTIGAEEYVGESQYGSPMKMQENNQWQWSNFTWQNESIPLDTVVGWRIYYMDTSGNVNCTDVMRFLINSPPNIPNNPTPDDNATEIPTVNTMLSWDGGDPDYNNTVTYDIYFGSINPPPKIISNQTETTYDLGLLNYSTTYYWKIVSWDNHDASTIGPLWHFTTVMDTTPPETNISFSGTLGNNGWYITPVTITLTATDSQSSVNFTMNNIDSSGWTIYSSPFVVSTDGNHTISYYSVDKVGNIEVSKTENLKIDKTKPAITLNKQQIDLFNVKFTAQVNDETSDIERVEFALDGVLQSNDTQSPYEWTWTGIGNHQVTATAYDMAGNSQSQSMSTPVEQIQGMKSVQLQMMQQLIELNLRLQGLR